MLGWTNDVDGFGKQFGETGNYNHCNKPPMNLDRILGIKTIETETKIRVKPDLPIIFESL
jgi:hypothetical protein